MTLPRDCKGGILNLRQNVTMGRRVSTKCDVTTQKIYRVDLIKSVFTCIGVWVGKKEVVLSARPF